MSDKPTNVIEALVAVSRDVDAIAKAKTANAGGTFKYRGIEEVLSACHDPFIRYGVVVVPQVTKAEVLKHEVVRSSGKVGFDFEAQVTVNYRIYGPGGPADFIDAPIFATGMDSSDKGTGKAMSYAYKQLMFQLLCIPTDAAEDNEATHHTMDRQPVPEDFYGWPSKPKHDEWWDVQGARLKALNDAALDLAIAKLAEAGLFDGRKPKLPFHNARKDEVEAIISHASVPTVAEALAEHSQRATAIMADVLGTPDAGEPEPWMWDLAEVEDLDAHDWKVTAKAMKWRLAQMLAQAQFVADRLMQNGAEVTVPERLDEIHGELAENLRLSLLMQEEPF